ncbi:MAG TPA: hypothetical protein VGF12_01235 [Roseateles sp.]|uniref:hypothetical protein n=1 Tax=Roseateles sp. TaxID=1971397 RepID=UPI002EDB0E4F
MLRWFRVLVIALLLPAYGLAAVVAPSYPDSDVTAPSSVGEEPASSSSDILVLIAELGDTTDDMSDHCLPHTVAIAAAPPLTAPASLGRRLAVEAPLAQPLRPPRPAA